MGAGRGGGGAAAGDAAADPGDGRQPPVGGDVRCDAGGGVPAAVGDRGAGDDGAGRGAAGAGAGGAGGRGHPEPRGVRLLSPRQRLRRARHRALGRARGDRPVPARRRARLELRAGVRQARPGRGGDVLVLLRSLARAAGAGEARRRRRAPPGARPGGGPGRAGVLLLLGPPGLRARAAGVRGRAPAAAEQQRRARGDRLRRAPPRPVGRGGGPVPRGDRVRPGLPAARLRPRRHLSHAAASTPRPSGSSTARSSSRPTGPSRTATRRCSIWSGTATARGRGR